MSTVQDVPSQRGRSSPSSLSLRPSAGVPAAVLRALPGVAAHETGHARRSLAARAARSVRTRAQRLPTVASGWRSSVTRGRVCHSGVFRARRRASCGFLAAYLTRSGWERWRAMRAPETVSTCSLAAESRTCDVFR